MTTSEQILKHIKLVNKIF